MTTIEHMKNAGNQVYEVQRKTCDCGGKILYANFSDGSEIEKCLGCGKES